MRQQQQLRAGRGGVLALRRVEVLLVAVASPLEATLVSLCPLVGPSGKVRELSSGMTAQEASQVNLNAFRFLLPHFGWSSTVLGGAELEPGSVGGQRAENFARFCICSTRVAIGLCVKN